jgi:hypothetical protein
VSAPRRILANVGCGAPEPGRLPAFFDSWQQLRVDIDPAVQPDLLADITDLSQLHDASVDAIWASHCLEHLYAHQVPLALGEFRRVLREDGFACVIVPDLQHVARYVAEDQLHEPLYHSPAGPITPHDIFFGFGTAIAAGQTSMSHRCGFTPTLLQQCFRHAPFGELMLRRRPAQFELVAVARAVPAKGDAERLALMAALEL